ncbi:unnamed protein product [Auanema sp. JU1783]|nr:unnamed protein product [Auanema sp. JU1783]
MGGQVVTHRSFLNEAFHFLICAGGILSCYFYFGIQQERIVQGKYANDEKFTYTLALVFFMCTANTIFAKLLRNPTDVDNIPTKMYGMCAFSYLAAMISSNQALQYLSYPTQVLAKSCKPIPVMLFGVFFAAKKYSLRKYFFVLIIVAGVALFLFKDNAKDSSNGYGQGEILLLTSLIMDGATTSLQEIMNQSHRKSPLSMMYYMNLYSSFYLLIGLIVTGELFSFIGFVNRHPTIVSDLSLLAISSCGGQYFIFKTINEFSPLTCSIITTTRKLFTIIISVIFMNHPLSQRQVIGTALVFGGLICDAIDSKFSKNKKK